MHTILGEMRGLKMNSLPQRFHAEDTSKRHSGLKQPLGEVTIMDDLYRRLQ